MPLPQAAAIKLSELQEALLTQEASRHQVSGQLRIRIEIILKASKGASNSALTREYSPKNHHMAKKWRDRWADKQEALHEMEELLQGQRAMKKRLLEAMLSILEDAKGRGRKSPFSAAQEDLIIAMACKKPSDYGFADSAWTQDLLAEAAVREGIVDSISQSKICSVLKKKSFSPTNRATG